MKKRKLPKQFIKKKLNTFFIKNKLRLFFIRTKLKKRSLLHFILTSIKNNKKLQKHLIINVILTLTSIVTICLPLYSKKNNTIELSYILNYLQSIRVLLGILFISVVNTFIYSVIKEYDDLSDMKWWLATSNIYLFLYYILCIISLFMVNLFNIKSFPISLYIPLTMAIVSDIIALIIFSIKTFFSKKRNFNEDNKRGWY